MMRRHGEEIVRESKLFINFDFRQSGQRVLGFLFFTLLDLQLKHSQKYSKDILECAIALHDLFLVNLFSFRIFRDILWTS
jgi:hypothetical protein